MVERLCTRYGKRLGKVGAFEFHTFPELGALAAAQEDELRELGLGYRAKFVCSSAQTVVRNGGAQWLHALRSPGTSLEEARTALETLHGVGSKVADCVCLFSLDKTAAIPVDTHVWPISVREMDASLAETKSLTSRVYQRVGDLWRTKYGAYAGWAHTILFAADLTRFRYSIHLFPPPLPPPPCPCQWRSQL